MNRKNQYVTPHTEVIRIEPVRTIAASGPSAIINDPTIGSARRGHVWMNDEIDYDAFVDDRPFVHEGE